MISRTLYFGNPAYLHLKQGQLLIEPRSEDPEEGPLDLPHYYRLKKTTVPIEDIGVMILDHPQLVLSQGLLAALAEANVTVMTCDGKHHPAALLMPLVSNTLTQERHEAQIGASEPLKKNLWQQTIIAKVTNQARHIADAGVDAAALEAFAKAVQSGDSGNIEAQAAAWYWPRVFQTIPQFRREPMGEGSANPLLNYGYAVLRAVVARAIVGAGLLPTLGLHHRNRYNPFCLADDVMEPYRPWVDALVRQWVDTHGLPEDGLDTEMKKHLLRLPALDVLLDGQIRPLMVAVHFSATSLMKCFEGSRRKILYPEWTLSA